MKKHGAKDHKQGTKGHGAKGATTRHADPMAHRRAELHAIVRDAVEWAERRGNKHHPKARGSRTHHISAPRG